MKACPVCGRPVFETAVKCQHCDASLRGPMRFEEPGGPSGSEGMSGKAIASLIFGIFFFLFPAAVLAIIFGHLSRSDIRRSGGRLRGTGMASTGLVLGYLGAGFVPIILIIAAIAIPNLLRSKMAANEASAVGSLRVINTACVTYSSTYNAGFPKKLAALGPSGQPSADAADLIDENLAGGQKAGYLFSYATIGYVDESQPGQYNVNADPLTPGATGTRHFYSNQTAIIRYDMARPATEKSPTIQ